MELDRETGLAEALDGIWYTIDRDMTIRSVSRKSWSQGAKRNDLSDAFSADRIIGKNLMQFIHGEETRTTYERFCDAIFSGKRGQITFDHRCDSPGVRRDIRMSIRPLLKDSTVVRVVFHNVEMSVAQRPPINLLLNRTAEGESFDALSICSFCKQVRSASDPRFPRWISAEDYYRRGGDSRVLLSHSICEDCRQNIVEPNA